MVVSFIIKVAKLVQQQNRELMSSYDALNAGLGLSPATEFVYIIL
jgi:hypothetical protein